MRQRFGCVRELELSVETVGCSEPDVVFEADVGVLVLPDGGDGEHAALCGATVADGAAGVRRGECGDGLGGAGVSEFGKGMAKLCVGLPTAAARDALT